MAQTLDALEERLAHMIRQVEDLSDEVARQSREIDILNRRVAMLMQREAERESDGGGGGVVMGDERPPHY